MKSATAAAAIAMGLALQAGSATGATCVCTNSGGNVSISTQSGDAFCSVTQAPNYCATVQTGGARGLARIAERSGMARHLQAADIGEDPSILLHDLVTKPPAQWGRQRTPSLLYAAFLASGARLEGHADALWSAILSRQGDIMDIFLEPSVTTPRPIDLSNDYRAMVRYGCMEVRKDDFRTMIALPGQTCP